MVSAQYRLGIGPGTQCAAEEHSCMLSPTRRTGVGAVGVVLNKQVLSGRSCLCGLYVLGGEGFYVYLACVLMLTGHSFKVASVRQN